MRVEHISVGEHEVDVIVRFAADEPLRSSAYPRLPGRLLELLPKLALHDCENDRERPFVAELGDTELAHVFEHVTLELMARAGSPRTTRASTTWDFRRDGRGVFHVAIAYDDDLVALGAIKLADALLRHLVEAAPPPNLAPELARLRALRKRRRM